MSIVGGTNIGHASIGKRSIGGDLVTMSVPTEMAYARQLNINYASLIAISNAAEGLGKWDEKKLSDLYPRLHAQSIEIYLATVRRIHYLRNVAVAMTRSGCTGV